MSFLKEILPQRNFREELYPSDNFTTNNTKESKEKLSFSIQSIKDGVGEYNINHFIGYFNILNNLNTDQNLKYLDNQFLRIFPEIFSKKNIAIATNDFDNKIKFKVTARDGFFHEDWVSMHQYKTGDSFYAKTLKRNTSYDWEKNAKISDKLAESLFPALISTIAKELPIAYLIEINKMHFLSGRRSWRFGFDHHKNLYYFETTALEMNSHYIYNIMEGIREFREKVKIIWSTLIYNFAAKYGYELLEDSSLLGYEKYNLGNVYYKLESHETVSDALGQEWIKDVFARNQGLIEQDFRKK